MVYFYGLLLFMTGFALATLFCAWWVSNVMKLRYMRRVSVCKYEGRYGVVLSRDFQGWLDQMHERWLRCDLQKPPEKKERILIRPTPVSIFHSEELMHQILKNCFIEWLEFYVPEQGTRTPEDLYQALHGENLPFEVMVSLQNSLTNPKYKVEVVPT